MYRVDTSTACAAMPVPSAPGTPGWFQNANPALGIPATMPGADFFNMVQAELENIVIGAGLTPDKTDRSQVWKAIQSIAATGAAIAGAVLWSRPVSTIVTVLPASPLNGDRYLIAKSGTTGAAVGYENNAAEYIGGEWKFSGLPQDQQTIIVGDGGANIVGATGNKLPSRTFIFSSTAAQWFPCPLLVNGNVPARSLTQLNRFIINQAWQTAAVQVNLFDDSIGGLLNSAGRTILQEFINGLAAYMPWMDFFITGNDRHVNGSVTTQMTNGSSGFPSGIINTAMFGAAPGVGFQVPDPPWPGNDNPNIVIIGYGTNDSAVDSINSTEPPSTIYNTLASVAKQMLAAGKEVIFFTHHLRTGATQPPIDGVATWPPGHTGTSAAYPAADPGYDPFLYGMNFQVDIRQILVNRIKRQVASDIGGIHVIDAERKFIEYVYRYGMTAVQGSNSPHPLPLGMDAYAAAIAEFFAGLSTSTQQPPSQFNDTNIHFFGGGQAVPASSGSPVRIDVPANTAGTLFITVNTIDGLHCFREVAWNFFGTVLAIKDRDSAGSVRSASENITGITVQTSGGVYWISVAVTVGGTVSWKTITQY